MAESEQLIDKNWLFKGCINREAHLQAIKIGIKNTLKAVDQAMFFIT